MKIVINPLSFLNLVPSWKVHNYWCRELKISEDVANGVNLLIDFPKKWIEENLDISEGEIKEGLEIGSKDVEYIGCRESLKQILIFEGIAKNWEKRIRVPIKFGHDFGRQRKWQTEILLICAYEHYGVQGIKAAILHHILDYIESIAEKFYKNEVLRRVEKKFNWLTYPINPKKADQKYYEYSLVVSESAKEVLSFVKEKFDDILAKL